MYAVILAGGSGKRFWPLSRDKAPKQLQPLFEERTLLEAALDRVEKILPKENIVILTAATQRDAVLEVLQGRISSEQVIAEPARKDTAPAVVLGAAWVAQQDANATMAILPSDHLVENEAEFSRCLQAALDLAKEQQALVTLGIQPTWPCPSYGYIERGEQLLSQASKGVTVHEVVQFREKPDTATATEYLQRGCFAWNAGMFCWSLPTLQAQLEKYCPELAVFLQQASASKQAFLQAKEQDFAKLTPISIDFALLEKADRVISVSSTFDWDDVGGWPAVANRLPVDELGNAHKGEITALEAKNNISFSATGKHVALLGVENLVVVETQDSVMVVPRDRVDEIKKIVALLPENLR